MPLKPAMVAFHPRKPEPADKRAVSCPSCGKAFEISAKAMSVRCPSCTRPLQFSDLDIKQRLAGEVATMGRVELHRSGEISGKLVCGELASDGSFQGDALVYGRLRLRDGSLTTGTLTARAIATDPGATLRGRLAVSPSPTVRGRLADLANSSRQYRPRKLRPSVDPHSVPA
ncbi:MAG: polymer-forming cytoskeletal protein [Planctomycetota bacterium]